MTPPLHGFKMLDLSRQLPGPYASMLLADLGMDCLVVAAPDDRMGIGLHMVQRNKRHMTLNLKHLEGREIFSRLVRDCDVVLEGFRPGVTDRLGIDYKSVAAINPGVVYCSISGYGQDGPYRDKVGHDINYLGYAGVLGVSGAEGNPPTLMPVQVADIGGGGQTAAVGILAALLARQQTGRGQYIDVSMMDGSIAFNVYHLISWGMLGGKQPPRGETMLTGRYPCYAVYETKEGKHVTIGALEPHFWRNLCNALGRPEYIEHQFSEGEKRAEVFAFLREAFKAQTQSHWIDKLGPIDICFGPVSTIDEMIDDPQVRHRGMIDRDGGDLRVASPLKFSAAAPLRPGPPPVFGQHTEEVLRGLGIDAARLAELKRAGVV